MREGDHDDLLQTVAQHLLQRRQAIVFAQALVVVDAEAQLDHAVDEARKMRGLLQVEARGQQGGVEEQPDLILHDLARQDRSWPLPYLPEAPHLPGGLADLLHLCSKQ